MKTRCISLVAAALTLSATFTLVAQGQAPPAGAQAKPPAPAGAQAPAPGGLSPAQQRLLPKALNAPDIKFEVVKDFIKMPPNVYMGEGIGVGSNSKGHIFVNTCAQQTRNF